VHAAQHQGRQAVGEVQIGERLYVSPRTVQTHLAHVFAKLGISTRTQLAAKAAHQQAR
jgi:DNA-binding CsgD family transcriptional regulator